MACGSCSAGRNSYTPHTPHAAKFPSASSPVASGYVYTFNGVATTFLTKLEALKAQRRNGGGTIKGKYA